MLDATKMSDIKYNKAKKPLKVGQKIDVKCTLEGRDKDGIAPFGDSHFMIIVRGGKIGKEYSITIDKVCKNVAFGFINKK